MRILADEQIPFFKPLFEPFGLLQTSPANQLKTRLVDGFDALLVRSVTSVDEDFIADTRLKFIGTATNGTDHVDIAFLKSRGIQFADAAGCNTQAVAEYVLSCFASLVLSEDKCLDKTVGIIGCGRIGGQVLKFMQRLGAQILVNDPLLEAKSNAGVIPKPNFRFCSLQEALSADFITFHVPLKTTGPFPTWHLLNMKTLATVNPSAVLVNTSRGGIIDDVALGIFMKKYPKMRVILDVWQHEPDINIDILGQIAYGTPHIAGYSLESKYNATKILQKKFCACLGYLGHQPLDITLSPFGGSAIVVDKTTMIKNIILTSYDMRVDAKLLANSKRSKIADTFYTARKNYPLRREFSVWPLHIKKPVNQMFLETLRRLGFQSIELC